MSASAECQVQEGLINIDLFEKMTYRSRGADVLVFHCERKSSRHARARRVYAEMSSSFTMFFQVCHKEAVKEPKVNLTSYFLSCFLAIDVKRKKDSSDETSVVFFNIRRAHKQSLVD